MSVSRDKSEPMAADVSFTPSSLQVIIADGRKVSAPVEWFPRLHNTTDQQRKNWRLIGRGRRNPLGRCRRGYLGRKSLGDQRQTCWEMMKTRTVGNDSECIFGLRFGWNNTADLAFREVPAPLGRTIVFIDNSNIFRGQLSAGWRIDARKLHAFLEKAGEIRQT